MTATVHPGLTTVVRRTAHARTVQLVAGVFLAGLGALFTLLLVWVGQPLLWMPSDIDDATRLVICLFGGPGLLLFGLWAAAKSRRLRPRAVVYEIGATGLTVFETAAGRAIDPPAVLAWHEIASLRRMEGGYGSADLAVVMRDGRKYRLPARMTDPYRSLAIDAMLAAARAAGVEPVRRRIWFLLGELVEWRFLAE